MAGCRARFAPAARVCAPANGPAATADFDGPPNLAIFCFWFPVCSHVRARSLVALQFASSSAAARRLGPVLECAAAARRRRAWLARCAAALLLVSRMGAARRREGCTCANECARLRAGLPCETADRPASAAAHRYRQPTTAALIRSAATPRGDRPKLARRADTSRPHHSPQPLLLALAPDSDHDDTHSHSPGRDAEAPVRRPLEVTNFVCANSRPPLASSPAPLQQAAAELRELTHTHETLAGLADKKGLARPNVRSARSSSSGCGRPQQWPPLPAARARRLFPPAARQLRRTTANEHGPPAPRPPRLVAGAHT
jgi:hypothetical protein